MDKCREEFESSLGHTDGFHDGYVTWNEVGGMYMANDDEYECVADWMNGAFAIHKKMQAKVEELQKRVDQQGLVIAKVMSIASDFQQSWAMFEVGKKLEQALKGGGE